MTTVYIVLKGVPYEGYCVDEVFYRIEDAQKYIELNYPEFSKFSDTLYEDQYGYSFFIEDRVVI